MKAKSAKRRVIFCTYPSLYSDIVLDELLKAEPLALVGVLESTRVLSQRYNRLQSAWRHIQLSGLRYATYLWLVTDLYFALRYCLRKAGFRQRIKARHIPLLSCRDINSAESLAFLREQQADILLSAHFNQWLGTEVLAIPQLAALNIHPSLLPHFKGVDPAFYALLRFVQETGVTVHWQNEQFDSGPILEQTSLKVRPQDSLLSLNAKLFKLGAMSAVKQVLQLSKESKVNPQQGKGNYDSWPNPYDTKIFRQQRKYFRWKEYWAFVRR